MKNGMSLIIFALCFFSLGLSSQKGLENIIVEKYYVSDANDTLNHHVGGYLPIGSVTYRIFLDMAPEYRFYTCYGKQGHELKLSTTTKFFNNEDIGNKTPSVIPRRSMVRNTVMLDSWLSAGSAGEDYYGVLKEEDDSLETVGHEKSYLSNVDKSAGVPVRMRDGLTGGNNIPVAVLFGLDTLSYAVYNSTRGSHLNTSNGAWGCLGGAIGRDSSGTNKLLIAQFTTDGDFSFELNLQIGKKGHAPEFYVARNPLGGEFTAPFLSYDSKKSNGKKTKLLTAKTSTPVKNNRAK